MPTVEVEVYHKWWEFDTDTFPPLSLLTFPHHGGNMPATHDYDNYYENHHDVHHNNHQKNHYDFPTSGVATLGFDPPITPGLMLPVSWYLQHQSLQSPPSLPLQHLTC